MNWTTQTSTCVQLVVFIFVKGAILLYMGENASRVSCDLQLPPQVTRVIIHKYGKKQAICFAKKFRGTVIVRPGDELDGDSYEEK